MTAPTPTITIIYRPRGVAEVTAAWGPRSVTARGTWSQGGPVWLPGIYAQSHRVGLHRGRLGVVQQGRATMRVCDAAVHQGDLARATTETRRGWSGWNIHDDRGDLTGCIGLGARAMLDVLGICESAREVGAEQHQAGGVFVTVRVEHRP